MSGCVGSYRSVTSIWVGGWIGVLLGMMVLGVSAQESKLAYQGRLTEAGTPATGTFEMQFQLFDSPEIGTGTAQGGEVYLPEVAVQEGVFTAVLDFGVEVFDGSPRYLEISVKPAGSTTSFTTLQPRQSITPVPYAIRTLSASSLESAMVADGGGNVSIGSNAAPAGIRLNVDGVTRLAPGGSGGFVQVGTPNGETGLSIAGENRFDVRFNRDTATLAAGGNSGPPPPWNGLILNTNGNVGLGLATLASDSLWKLEVNGRTRITPVGTAGGAIQFSTPNGETGMSVLGLNRADLRFDDATLKLVAGPGQGPPGNTQGLSIDLQGFVGVGTSAPHDALHVAGGGLIVSGRSAPPVRSPAGLFLEYTPEQGALVRAFDHAEGRAKNLLLNAAGGNVGIGTANPVARLDVLNREPGQATISGKALATGGIGVYAEADLTGRALHAQGSATQSAADGGLAKALLFVDHEGMIVRCHNGVSGLSLRGGSTRSGCDFSVGRTRGPHGLGESPDYVEYILYFPFPVVDRYAVVTPQPSGTALTGVNLFYGVAGTNPLRGDPNALTVRMFFLDDLEGADASFTVVLF